MRQFLALFAALFFGAPLAACVSTAPPEIDQSVQGRQATADGIALAAGLSASILQLSPFPIHSYARGLEDSQDSSITIYVEGDGFAWASRTRPSADPTPYNPLALRLAASDPSPAVAYLARPCQYVSSSACVQRFWGNARFSEEMIAAMDEAVSTMKTRASASQIHLVGFSGGGAIVALLAARRSDVASLRTVAGYLDHVALNEAIDVSPLSGSLDPMQIAADLRHIPQLHLSGADDTVIPPWVAENFVAAQGESACATTLTQQGAGHNSGWVDAWPSLIEHPLPC